MNIIFFIIDIIFLTNLITINSTIQYRCGTNNLKIKPKILKPKIEIDKEDPSYKRRMDDIDEDGFKSFNIYVDKFNIEKELRMNKMEKYSDLIINSLDKAAGTLQKLLKVKPLENGIQFSNEELNDYEIYVWDKNKFGDDALKRRIDMNQLGIDLIIFSKIEDLGEYAIAASAPIYSQEKNNQPILGLIYINNQTNFTSPNIAKYLETTLIHEMTHILGFLIDYFEQYFKNTITKKDKYGIKRTYINSPKVLEVARKYFNCPNLDGVELEEYGDEGTAGSHWESRILLGDYMNGIIYSEEVISEISLALLEDFGFYKPNYYTGGLMRYGKNKGCEFVYDKCVNQTTYEINPKFENEFHPIAYSNNGIEPSCSSGRLSRMYNELWLYDDNIPIEYRYYYGDSKYGGWPAADFCPVSTYDIFEENDVYFSGICSGKEGGVYGSGVEYLNADGNSSYYLSKDIVDKTGEEISEHSFCFLSSLYKDYIDDVEYYSKTIRAICYKLFCSEKSLTVKIHDNYIVCPRAGGKIKAKGYEGYFLCPDYNLMCTGTVMCNDLFDCVDKKSEVKEETFIYDYEIKTSQNLYRAEESEVDNTNDYELADDGICQKFCKQCKENKKCLKCKDGYILLGNPLNEEVICESNENDKFKIGYFKDNNDIYYKCIDFCDECLDTNSCQKCKDGVEYNYNQCINLNIPNCAQSDVRGICEKCVTNFAFNDTDRSFCINKDEFVVHYYTKDNGISYTMCSKDISNCEQCEYDNINNNPKCKICKEDYSLSINENKCILKDEINTNKEYFYIDELNFKCKKCSDAINNCQKCTNETFCDKCMIDSYFLNDNKNYCYKRAEISNIKEYFLNEDKTAYLSCRIYNVNKNCLECSNKNICKKCPSDYYIYEGGCVKSDDESYIKISNFIYSYLLYLTIIIFF